MTEFPIHYHTQIFPKIGIHGKKSRPFGGVNIGIFLLNRKSWQVWLRGRKSLFRNWGMNCQMKKERNLKKKAYWKSLLISLREKM